MLNPLPAQRALGVDAVAGTSDMCLDGASRGPPGWGARGHRDGRDGHHRGTGGPYSPTSPSGPVDLSRFTWVREGYVPPSSSTRTTHKPGETGSLAGAGGGSSGTGGAGPGSGAGQGAAGHHASQQQQQQQRQQQQQGVMQRPPRPRPPSLLAKLLEKEIR